MLELSLVGLGKLKHRKLQVRFGMARRLIALRGLLLLLIHGLPSLEFGADLGSQDGDRVD